MKGHGLSKEQGGLSTWRQLLKEHRWFLKGCELSKWQGWAFDRRLVGFERVRVVKRTHWLSKRCQWVFERVWVGFLGSDGWCRSREGEGEGSADVATKVGAAGNDGVIGDVAHRGAMSR